MKKTSLAIALSLVLTACGSGGGGSAPSIQVPTVTPTPAVNNNSGTTASKPATAPTTQQKTTPSTQTEVAKPAQPQPETTSPNKPVVEEPVTPVQPQEPSSHSETTLDNTNISINKNDFIKGELNKEPVLDQNGKEIAKLSGYNRQYSFNGALTKSKEESLNQIIADNVFIKLANKVGAVGGLSGFGLYNAVKSLYNATKNPERDVFYFGDETAESNIPKSGVVTYKGNASRYDNVSAQVKNIGTSELTADFENKKIKGELKIDGLFRRNISLKETDIQGNSFNGEAVAGENHLATTRYGQYEGKFFGPNAEEVAGKATFAQEQKDLNTSFSAEQVK